MVLYGMSNKLETNGDGIDPLDLREWGYIQVIVQFPVHQWP